MTDRIDTWQGIENLSRWPEKVPAQAVLVKLSALNHISEKHICSAGEPWNDWIPAELLKRIQTHAVRTQGGWTVKLSPEVATELSGILSHGVRAAIGLPRVLIYDSKKITSCKTSVCWLLVLPMGAIAVIEFGGGCGILKTCYFPAGAGWRKCASERLKLAKRRLIARYGRFQAGSTGESKQKVVDKKVRFNCRFISPDNWGFN
ncbi:MAG: hypothetical protein IT448_06910 [Phycisphaerales bacterium]|nr:hypothetical protein [Phycisphaerales bacterium]